MASKELNPGTVIVTSGQVLNAVHLITQGSVRASFPGGEIILKKGDIIGLCDIAYDSHFFTYTVADTATLLSFPLKTAGSLKEIISGNTEVSRMFYTSMINQVLAILVQYARLKESCSEIYRLSLEYYDKYINTCNSNGIISRSLPQFESFAPLSLEDDLEPWLLGYYASYREFPAEINQLLPGFPAYIIGALNRSSIDIHSAFSVMEDMNDYYTEKMSVFMQENGIDMFDMYTGLLYRLGPDSPDGTAVKENIDQIIEYIKTHPGIDTDLVYERVSAYRTKLQGLSTVTAEESETEEVSPQAVKELANSLDVILDYSGVNEETANSFRKCIMQYKKLSDKSSTEDNARALRAEISKLFYQVYAEAFVMSVRDKVVPTILKMFFNFGFVDEELAGIENANYLYNLAEHFTGDSKNGVYTAYEWFYNIYNVAKDPSRNEFDVDFLAYLHEQKVTAKISAEDEIRLANDPFERLKFELENMFPMVNKITFGRLSTFCPVFSEHNIIKPLKSCLVTVDSIVESIKKVKQIDYSAFYRETVYTNEKANIPKEFIGVEVLPDVILMPNIGTRGVMWQEIEGRKRTTPARLMISAFHLEDLPTTFVRLVGEFRWEMCKRIQGARWNDVSDRSLTSEYFDYVQFYRKNNELSAEAKEKVKQSLIKSKNSFKEMFVRDYITWVLYEGTGSPRLNKIARTIMSTYCPFPKELRTKMGANPMFKEIIDHYEVKTAQKLHHLDNVIQKLNSLGIPVPKEITEHRAYIEGTV